MQYNAMKYLHQMYYFYYYFFCVTQWALGAVPKQGSYPQLLRGHTDPADRFG